MKLTEKDLIGKTILTIKITGSDVTLITTDGLCLEYDATDGGYSTWEIRKVKDKENK